MAPAPGFEPGTKWLTATYSTAELCRSMNISSSMLFNIQRFCEKANQKHAFFVILLDLAIKLRSFENISIYKKGTLLLAAMFIA